MKWFEAKAGDGRHFFCLSSVSVVSVLPRKDEYKDVRLTIGREEYVLKLTQDETDTLINHWQAHRP